MQTFFDFWVHLWVISLDTSPWLLLGLLAAGMLKLWLPQALMLRWLGGSGVRPVVNAALLGTPLPLCSCSVVFVALSLHRTGASKPATVSFLVATPENGVDSITLSYALLGPFLTVIRPIAAILSAITAGLLAMCVKPNQNQAGSRQADKPRSTDGLSLAIASDGDSPACHDTSCDDCGPKVETDSSCCDADSAAHATQGVTARLYFAIQDLFKDILFWLVIGLVLAAAIQAFIPPDAMTRWGSGLPAMLAMLLIGVPMYVCATASTPVAAAMLLGGVSPGTTLVFLLAGPATNLGTIGIIRKELGSRTCAAYLVAVCLVSVISGLVVDWLVKWLNMDIAAQAAQGGAFLPDWVKIASLILLVVLAVMLLWLKPEDGEQSCCDHEHG